MARSLCIHGHFYQPPRENPWLEEVEMQDSAYPYHDWNARVTAECYAQNARSRILDSSGRIARIVNNYANISFNFGPTLLSWLEAKEPDTYQAIIEADSASRRRFSGHGAALAQAYSHPIMPLANRRDKVTQVRWGRRDFEQRFKRPPEGMWLPETAADLETLEVLESEGILFTILSPYQAKRVRKVGERDWQDVEGGRVDPKRPYRVNLPNGKSLAVFFYDGPISRAVAFERLLNSGEQFAQRLLGGFSGGDAHEMVHIATDGESYGHHHRFGDMALAYALAEIEERRPAELTIYGEYLEHHPPEYEAEIIENSSWSCAHGVERWRSDCGCNTGSHPSWHQRWRAPLREALDWLRDHVAPLYERHAGQLFADPWAARDDYVSILLERRPERREAFVAEHARGELSAEQRRNALKLLELQRHAMYMYTSCGWFFDELSGIETVQVMQYGARVAQLAKEFSGEDVESEFVKRLEKAESNVPEYGDGRAVYQKLVHPAKLDLKRVVAHYAVSSLFEAYPESSIIYSYEVDQQAGGALTSGRTSLSWGSARVLSLVTLEEAAMSYAALHLGDHNIAGGVRSFQGADAYEAATKEVREAFQRADIPQVIRLFDKHFAESTFSLVSLFGDEQRRVIDLLLRETVETAEASYLQIYEQNAPLMLFLSSDNIPLPRPLLVAAERALNGQLRSAFEQNTLDTERIERVLAEAQSRRVGLDAPTLSFTFQQSLERVARAFGEEPTDLDRFAQLEDAVRLARSMPFHVELWYVQNLYHRLSHDVFVTQNERAIDGDRAARRWVERFIALGSRLQMTV